MNTLDPATQAHAEQLEERDRRIAALEQQLADVAALRAENARLIAERRGHLRDDISGRDDAIAGWQALLIAFRDSDLVRLERYRVGRNTRYRLVVEHEAGA